MTALRELAERWKSDGCRNGSSHECADELLAILDAEGDGGAVAWFTDDHLSDKSATTYSKEVADRWSAKGWPVNPLYPHPARSGVVNDEDVRDAERYQWLRNDPPTWLSVRKKTNRDLKSDGNMVYLDSYILDQAIDAAIQGERHER